jgi:hypothetical protein
MRLRRRLAIGYLRSTKLARGVALGEPTPPSLLRFCSKAVPPRSYTTCTTYTTYTTYETCRSPGQRLVRDVAFLWLVAFASGACSGQEVDQGLTSTEKRIEDSVLNNRAAFVVPPDNIVHGKALLKWITALSPDSGGVPRKIQISGAEIPDDLDLSDREIAVEVSLEHCTFDGAVNLERAVAKRDLSLASSAFKQCPSFKGATFESDFDLSGAQFLDDQHEVNLQRITTESELHFDEAYFFGGVNFFHGHWKGLVFLNSASVGNGKRGLFDDVKAEDDILGSSVQFGGPVSFNFSDDKGIYFTKCEFKGRAEFGSNTVSRSVSFENSRFDDRFSFRQNGVGQDFDLRNGQFVKQRDPLTKPTTENGLFEVDLWRTSVGGLTRFNHATFAGSLSLQASDLQALDIEDIKPWTRSKRTTSLKNATIRRFEGRPPEDFVRFIDRSEFDPGIYFKLEAFLKAEGQTRAADQVFIHEQNRDRQTRLKGMDYLKNLIWGAVTGFGRQVWLALIWSAGVVAIGSVLFWRSSDMQLRDEKFTGRKYNPIWFSLDVFAPVIDLEEASVWCPRPDRPWKWFYLRVHRILGWILVPIGIVAITGALQGGAQ